LATIAVVLSAVKTGSPQNISNITSPSA